MIGKRSLQNVWNKKGVNNSLIIKICEMGTKVGIPQNILQDGREAVVVTIGTPETITNIEPALKSHSSSFDGNVYG